ncbi:hypothetical protein ILUMI_15684 [Ignelater luminosus]|uniref:Uncharacterized protein n=1 Tax=Ignelater luminosus TaxID=2038154 RepID=A0A8K0G8W0_IGNLU|nr:hypothetical protein ILUMI_15684 [Ignelater luminosus]
MLIIQIERDGIDAEKDFAEIQEDKEDEAELSNSDNGADRDEEVWVSKDGTIQWGTKEPTRKNIISRSIVKLASGIPRHLNLFTPHTTERRGFLLELGEGLVKPQIEKRIQNLQSKTRRIYKAVEHVGFDDLICNSNMSTIQKNKRGRYSICPRQLDKKQAMCVICAVIL